MIDCVHRVQLVLSSGGVRTLAYVGVLQALERNDIEVASVSAVSAGTLVGALIASGQTGDELEEKVRGDAGDLEGLGWSQFSLVDRIGALRRWPFAPRDTGKKVATELVKRFGLQNTRFKHLEKPFATMAIDVMTSDHLVFTTESHPELCVRDALGIATALPIATAPWVLGNRVLVDAAIATRSPIWLTSAFADSRLADLPIIVVGSAPQPAVPTPKRIDRYVQRIADSIAIGSDRLILRGSPRVHTFDLPTNDVGAFDTSLDAGARVRLIDIGRRYAEVEIDKVGGDFRAAQPARTAARVRARAPESPMRHSGTDLELAAWVGANAAQRFDAPLPEVFISYAREDRTWLEALLRHAAHHSGFTTWADPEIRPGAPWSVSIRDAISRADAAILLISDRFENSDFIPRHELPQLKVAHQKRGIPIMPIYIDKTSLRWAGIDQHQGLNDPGSPLSGINSADEYQPSEELDDALREIVTKVADAVTLR